MNYTKDEFIKETGLTTQELDNLRETFKNKYATKMGWNPKKLTQEQINEILKQPEWSNPLILS